MGAACSLEYCTDDNGADTKRKHQNTDPADKHVRASRRRDRHMSDLSVQINPIHLPHHSVRSTFDLDAGVADMLSKIQIQTPVMPEDTVMMSPVITANDHMTPGDYMTPGAPIMVTPGADEPVHTSLHQLTQHHSNTITTDRVKEWDTRELMNLENEMEMQIQTLARSQSMTGAHSLLNQQPAHGSVHSVSATIPGVAYFPDRQLRVALCCTEFAVRICFTYHSVVELILIW